MTNRLPDGIGAQAGFRRVRADIAVVDEHVVPGLMSLGLGVVRQIPGWISLADCVHRHDHAAVTVAYMFDEFPGCELRRGHVGVVIIEYVGNSNHRSVVSLMIVSSVETVTGE